MVTWIGEDCGSLIRWINKRAASRPTFRALASTVVNGGTHSEDYLILSNPVTLMSAHVKLERYSEYDLHL
jgi:hypothetical protein